MRDIVQPMNLMLGDCLQVMRGMEAESVDAIVTDPPYGLSFMGKKWDYDVPSVEVWRECLRVLKPGGHLLAFAGTRTQHRMACNIEDAGFDIRDMIAWVYGSGFPKSLDVSKAIDKAAGAEREVVGHSRGVAVAEEDNQFGGINRGSVGVKQVACDVPITIPATDAAKQWDGWGTALKPAMEPITVARKPLIGTVAENVLRHGTGAINVDGCRVAMASEADAAEHRYNCEGGYKRQKNWHLNDMSKGTLAGEWKQPTGEPPQVQGRWPANLIHDGSDEVVGLFPQTTSGNLNAGHKRGQGQHTHEGGYVGGGLIQANYGGDSGSAARFFYCAKANKADREEGNHHPTVKPTDLMRYLVRLVTPPNGIVLDPFMGSGSTGKACVLEGFGFIGIEREADYIEIARARIEACRAK